MIKLIVTDLDGSLLTDAKELPPDFWQVEHALAQKGIVLAIASGRPFHNIATVFERAKDRLYFICDNGSYMVHEDEELLVNPLQPQSIRSLIETSRPLQKVYPVLCTKHLAYIENEEEEFKLQALKYYQEYKIVPDLIKVDDEILKISFCDLLGSENNSYPHYKQFEKAYKVAVAGEIWLDITNNTASKGNAIKVLQQKLHITPQETLVFGDFLNDLDMIENAGYSYAMKNAHPQIIQAAKYITEQDNNHFGVTQTIKQIIEI